MLQIDKCTFVKYDCVADRDCLDGVVVDFILAVLVFLSYIPYINV